MPSKNPEQHKRDCLNKNTDDVFTEMNDNDSIFERLIRKLF